MADAKRDIQERALELACEYLADYNASKTDWQQYFIGKATDELYGSSVKEEAAH